MGYAFKPDHPGYNLVTMRQLAMRYDAGEELASITTNLAVPSESTNQVDILCAVSTHVHAIAAIIINGCARTCLWQRTNEIIQYMAELLCVECGLCNNQPPVSPSKAAA